mgnify:FL=1
MHKIFKKYWILTRLSHPRKMILLFLMYTAALKASLSTTHLCPHFILSLHKNNFLVCTNSKVFDMFTLLNKSCFNTLIEKIRTDSHNCYKDFSIPNYGANVP